MRLTASPDLGALPENSWCWGSERGGTPGDYIFRYRGEIFRFHVLSDGHEPCTAVLPFDELLDVRTTAATRLSRALEGRPVGANPAAVTRERQARLILALRAVDARRAGVTNREIAAGLFPTVHVPPEAWISHDVRDRTARLVRLGAGLVQGGYRQLLLYPHRGRRIN